mmetsp:Transcript_26238/g.62382  ORF Transcript_26238/g.62382 Transcript_26238/m.62382 type:complete len:214 (+) Transcript_26238:846-1487(+)
MVRCARRGALWAVPALRGALGAAPSGVAVPAGGSDFAFLLGHCPSLWLLIGRLSWAGSGLSSASGLFPAPEREWEFSTDGRGRASGLEPAASPGTMPQRLGWPPLPPSALPSLPEPSESSEVSIWMNGVCGDADDSSRHCAAAATLPPAALRPARCACASPSALCGLPLAASPCFWDRDRPASWTTSPGSGLPQLLPVSRASRSRILASSAIG